LKKYYNFFVRKNRILDVSFFNREKNINKFNEWLTELGSGSRSTSSACSWNSWQRIRLRLQCCTVRRSVTSYFIFNFSRKTKATLFLGYEDDIDWGDEFLYTGAGGRDLSGNKRTSNQSCDQTLTRTNKLVSFCFFFCVKIRKTISVGRWLWIVTQNLTTKRGLRPKIGKMVNLLEWYAAHGWANIPSMPPRMGSAMTVYTRWSSITRKRVNPVLLCGVICSEGTIQRLRPGKSTLNNTIWL